MAVIEARYNNRVKISNFEGLAITELRISALKIAEAGLLAIETGRAVKETLQFKEGNLIAADRKYELLPENKLIIVGVGKCAIEAGKAAEEILGDRISGGIVLDTRENNICEFVKIECFKGTHPFASEQNIAATQKIIEILKELNKNDLVIFLISGGGSTLLCLPEEGYNCLPEKLIVSALFNQGATIQEINTIRKHTSLARGGYLAKHAYPARVVSLIFSDVPGDDLSFVASGPTVKDTTTMADADAVLSKYGVLQTCSLEHCGLLETPKEEKYFENVYNYLAVSNTKALEAMRAKAVALGFSVAIIDSQLAGEARKVGEKIAALIQNSNSQTAKIYGGETTVIIKSKGKGGRNQELALSALSGVGADTLVLALASDGRDNGPYAGAIADAETQRKAEAQKLEPQDFLQVNNSSEFFEKTGDLLMTGETGANVSDLIIALKN